MSLWIRLLRRLRCLRRPSCACGAPRQPLAVGDVVRLASGGCEMTVTGVRGLDPSTGRRESISVAWQGDGPQVYQACFAAAAFVRTRWN